MKTASLTYQLPHYIETAPLAERYELLTAAIMTLMDGGKLAKVLKLSCRLVRLMRVLTNLERKNCHTKLKLDMLMHKSWRERVLKQLGGKRKLKLWDKAKARLEARKDVPVKPTPNDDPAWLRTPERIAESERLKARARLCGRATAHPRVFRDKCRMDFEGQFRLAPLPRGPQMARQVKVYTKISIVDYNWNNIPFGMAKGFGPAVVWPVEFYAAEKAEASLSTSATTSVIPDKERSDAEPGPNNEDSIVSVGPASQCYLQSKNTECGMTRKDDDVEQKKPRTTIPTIPTIPTISLKIALPPKVYWDIYAPLPPLS